MLFQTLVAVAGVLATGDLPQPASEPCNVPNPADLKLNAPNPADLKFNPRQ